MAPLKLPLQVSCPNCQQGNLPGSPYCGRCGAPLTEVAPTAAPSSRNAGGSPPNDAITNSLGEGQDPILVKQSYERASAIMTSGEKIEYIAVAGRPGLGHGQDCVIATSKRLIVYRKKVLGKYELDDCYWRDVAEASTKDGKGGITLTFNTIQRWHITVEGLPEAQARRVYQIATQHSERLGEVARTTLTLTTGDLNTGPTGVGSAAAAVPSAVEPAAAVPTAASPVPTAGVGAPLAITPLPIRPGPAWPTIPTQASESNGQATAVPAQADAAQPSPVVTQLPAANFVPTPESVLQNILQQSQAVPDGGAPTRPMQFSAAAFQAPALADPQSVTIRDTDTEPHMRPAPPMPTLEQIAVFSGPLAFNHISTPLTPLPGSGPLGSSSGPISGALSSPIAPISAKSADASSNGSGGENDFVALTSEELAAVSPIAMKPDQAPALVDLQTEEPTDFDGADPVVQEYDNEDETASGSPLVPSVDIPGPGSLTSGPLLAASHELGQDVTEPVLDSGGLSTQRLYPDGGPESDSDRPTDINLGQYGMSGPLMGKSGRSASAKAAAARSANGSAPSRMGQGKGNNDDPVSKMRQLKMLLDSGFITEEDYQEKKADILARFF